MSPLFTAIVVILALLAVMGIVVGVANDAVNFLNSALGSKVAPRRVILWVAAAGILVGTLTSSGMMEVARSGVFYTGPPSIQEIMMLFLGMMLGNVLLLDLYNTLGLPTSTTVSMVFGLLGAGVAAALFHIWGDAGASIADLSQYINTGLVMAIIAVISGVVVDGVSLVNKVEDSLRPDDSTPTIQEEVKTAEEYKGDVVNILVCGIDYEEGRDYSSDGTTDGMTDMILYCQFDIKGGALRMLQIPRNSLVATKGRKVNLSNGKTYSVSNYQINSVALSNGGNIAALAEVIYDQYKLPIDYYVTIDMQALVEMVDNFGGIEVYIPHDMSFAGSALKQGYRNLDGSSAEFFVRCRHGEGYSNSDIDRLNMQRYFYAGLFKRVRSMGITDVLNQLPLVFKNYIKTDMDISTIAKLVVSFLKLDSSNIILAQTPVFMGVPNVGKTDTFAGYSCVVPDAGSIANLLIQ